MLARATLLLPLAALCGCFADGGFGSGPTGGPTAPDPSTSQTSTGGSVDTDPTTTASPTTAADPTGDVTTGPATTTTTTTGAPACPGAMECQPGAVEDLGACDPCGARSRTCLDDCTWGAETCTQSSVGCGHWVFDPLGNAWDHVKPQGDAPTEPTLAALDLSAHGQLVVFTPGAYRTFTPLLNKWSAPAPITDALPGLPEPIQLAYSVWNPDAQVYDLILVGAQTAYTYQLTPGALPAAKGAELPCCSDWTPDVPDPGLTNIRDIFLDLDNPSGWAQADITALCALNDPTALSRYAAWVLPDRVLVQDVGYCFKMVYQTPYTKFAPFAVAGAPPGEFVGGTALLGGKLYVFAGD